MFTLCLNKEFFKFSCSHFTILSKDRAERLHGHNYQMSVEISIGGLDADLGFAFDFNQAKPVISKFCNELDERILLPLKSPYLQINRALNQVEVRFSDRHYIFPTEDTICLPLTNITAEELARYAWHELAAGMASLTHWTSLRVRIEETRGQSVSYEQPRGL